MWVKGRNCSLQFSIDHISDVRSYCASLRRTELDMVLLGQIMALSEPMMYTQWLIRAEVRSFFTVDGIFSLPEPNCNIPPNSNQLSAHYSFDYAQQVHYPSDPLQPGPIFFLTPRKCSLFGVHCEALPRQINFLTDEAADSGKGANAVISQLHYFFSHHGLGEMEVYLHCNNCSGQNKNNTMLHYLLWRSMTGLHTKITLSFLVVGHTKFAPDWCFRLVK